MKSYHSSLIISFYNVILKVALESILHHVFNWSKYWTIDFCISFWLSLFASYTILIRWFTYANDEEKKYLPLLFLELNISPWISTRNKHFLKNLMPSYEKLLLNFKDIIEKWALFYGLWTLSLQMQIKCMKFKNRYWGTEFPIKFSMGPTHWVYKILFIF